MASLEKLQIGTVVSTKMDKTVVVRIDRQKRHRLYGKTLRTTHRYKAHDENSECTLGDVVRISETRPLSREKRWRVVEIVQKGDVAELAPTEVASTLLEEISTAADANTAARIEAERVERAARAAAAAAAEEAASARRAAEAETDAEDAVSADADAPADLQATALESVAPVEPGSAALEPGAPPEPETPAEAEAPADDAAAEEQQS